MGQYVTFISSKCPYLKIQWLEYHNHNDYFIFNKLYNKSKNKLFSNNNQKLNCLWMINIAQHSTTDENQ